MQVDLTSLRSCQSENTRIRSYSQEFFTLNGERLLDAEFGIDGNNFSAQKDRVRSERTGPDNPQIPRPSSWQSVRSLPAKQKEDAGRDIEQRRRSHCKLR